MPSELQFQFEHEGRIVRPGQMMHIHPSHHRAAGATAIVERHHGNSVTLRTDNGAVPQVPLAALSWVPHSETVAMEELTRAGFPRPSKRDIAIWIAAREALLAARLLPEGEQFKPLPEVFRGKRRCIPTTGSHS